MWPIARVRYGSLSIDLDEESRIAEINIRGPEGDAPATVDEVIGLVQLDSKRQARFEKLSGGQKQRLSLACALVGDPQVLFLDEPTTGLDPQARLQLWEIVEEFKAGGGTVLLTTHYMEEAARLCDRVGVVDQGRCIALGSPAELIASLGSDRLVELAADGDLDEAALTALPAVSDVHRGRGEVFVLSSADIEATLPPLLALLDDSGLGIERLTIHEATLEDVFVYIPNGCASQPPEDLHDLQLKLRQHANFG